jgi:twitching motility protein PilT
VCRQRTGIKACIRLIPDEIPTLAKLELPAELARVQDYHQGLIVISGPNGHGKTTTLAALVGLYNETRPAHIITVEDPVEFLHPPKRAVVSQREVGVHTRSFQSALKGALREDPDIIAIGELRDRETVEMALTASETGHIVLATMSTPNGASTIERLIDMFAPEDQAQVRATLAGSLKLIISQRLVPSLDGKRLVPAAELITGNVPLWTLIRDNKLYQLPSLLQRGRAYGMIRVEDSLNEWLERGVIDLETARMYADDPKSVGAVARNAEPALNPANAPGMMGMFRKKG